MDLKQEHCKTYEHYIKTDTALICGQTEEYDSISIKSEKFQSEEEDELGDMYSIFESQVTGQLVSLDEFKQDVEFEMPKIEQRSDLVDEQVHIFPTTTVKLEVENAIKVEETDISDVKQEVCEYIEFKNESELLTSNCDLPTLKSENYPDYLAPSCSSDQTQQIINSLECVSKNCSQLHPCLDCQKNYPPSQSGLSQFDGHLNKQFSDSSQLLNHVTINSNETQFKCELCFKEFDKQFRLQEHLTDHSFQERSNKPIECNICSQKFYYEHTFKQHLRIHSNENSNAKPFKCDICSKGFYQKFSLWKHLVIHTNEKPFKCDICSEVFTQKSDFQQHLLHHTNKKLFKCDTCSKAFYEKFKLQRHLKSHTNEKLFKCNICSKKLNHKNNLKQHLLTHSNDKPFKCDICSKKFNLKSNLWRHLIIHTNEKQFKCDICSKEFIQKANLQRHFSLIHTNEKEFKCDICSKEFTQKGHFQQHLLVHTKKKLFK